MERSDKLVWRKLCHEFFLFFRFSGPFFEILSWDLVGEERTAAIEAEANIPTPVLRLIEGPIFAEFRLTHRNILARCIQWSKPIQNGTPSRA
jgi:hypothetical protein